MLAVKLLLAWLMKYEASATTRDISPWKLILFTVQQQQVRLDVCHPVKLMAGTNSRYKTLVFCLITVSFSLVSFHSNVIFGLFTSVIMSISWAWFCCLLVWQHVQCPELLWQQCKHQHSPAPGPQCVSKSFCYPSYFSLPLLCAFYMINMKSDSLILLCFHYHSKWRLALNDFSRFT